MALAPDFPDRPDPQPVGRDSGGRGRGILIDHPTSRGTIGAAMGFPQGSHDYGTPPRPTA